MDKTKQAISVFDKYAKEYEEKFMEVDLYHDTFDLFCNAVEKQNAYVLELGCGPGNVTKYLLKKRPGINILATDLSLKMLELAEVNNPKATFQLLDCRDIVTLSEKYDAIMCGFCLPYLTKEEAMALIKDASKILRTNGVLYISTMEDDYNKSGLKTPSSGDPDTKMFIHYHQADYLTAALMEYGFKILDLRHQDYPQQDGSITKDLIVIAKK